MNIIGFQSGHDVSYSVLNEGVPVICEEMERITRKKMQRGDGLQFFFSRNSGEFLSDSSFSFGNLKGRRGRVFHDRTAERQMNKVLSENGGKFYEFGHHLSHAANAFFTSDFEKALVVTMDAGGWEDDSMRASFTVSQGIKNKIWRLETFSVKDLDLGGAWHKLTKEVFGLSVGYPKGDQAGTVMAMATMGSPKYMDMFPITPERVEKLKAIASVSESDKFDVAASLQLWTEETFLNIAKQYFPYHENVCLSGGVSLNCVMTGKIKNWFPNIKNIFCDPIPYDGGLSLGSARYLWHDVLENPRIYNSVKNSSPYLGKSYPEVSVISACRDSKIQYKYVTDDDVLKELDNQKIVAVFGGRSEIGRRALGNRSILVDPRNSSMKQKINENVKHRQWFRPFAPSILEERVKDWFEDEYLSPYMSFALKFKESVKDKVPAVVHYDGTGRLQTVNKSMNPWYYEFISKWEKVSGVPILLNTSFNDTEPIVETPEDAIHCFLNTKIDYLYFFDYGILVEKNNDYIDSV